MSDHPDDDDDDGLRMAWQRQPTVDAGLPLDEVKHRAQRLRRRVALRNAVEYLACAAVIAALGSYLWTYPFPLMRAGSVLLMLATAWVARQLHVRASMQPAPADLGEHASLDFLLRQLARQRDAQRSAWRWYALPFVPGLVVFRWGVETELDASAPFARGWVANLSIALVFLAVVAFNQVMARRTQRRIDGLRRGEP